MLLALLSRVSTLYAAKFLLLLRHDGSWYPLASALTSHLPCEEASAFIMLPDQHPSNGTRSYQAELRVVGWQTLLLVARIGSAVAVLGAHLVLNFVVSKAAPHGFEKPVYFLEIIFFVCFALVYVHLAYEMVAIFIPRLRSRQ